MWSSRNDALTDLLASDSDLTIDRTAAILKPRALAHLYDAHWLIRRVVDLPVDMALADGFYTSPATVDPIDGEADPLADPDAPPPEEEEADPEAKPKPAVKPVAKKDALPGVPPPPVTKAGAVTVAVKDPGAAPNDPNAALGPQLGMMPPAPKKEASPEDDEGYQIFLKWDRTPYSPDGITYKAAKLGRLQGGHAVIVGTESDPALEYAGEATVWIDEVGREELSVAEWEEDANSPMYRTPVLFEVAAGHARGPLKIHHSKVIIFPGLTTAKRVHWQERHWTLSVIAPLISALIGYDNAISGLTRALGRFDVGVLKSAGLFAALDILNKEEIEARKQVFNEGIKDSRTIFLDPEQQEEYTRLPLDMGGLPEAIQIVRDDVSGATGIQQTHLFGIAPEGFNGGEEQSEIVDRAVKWYREGTLRPALSKLMSLLLATPTEVTFDKPKADAPAGPADPNDPDAEDPLNPDLGEEAPDAGVPDPKP